MKILVIGGGGYLGIPLSYKLKLQGHSVLIYDIFKYASKNLIPNDIDIIESSVSNVEILKSIVNRFDIVVYLSQPRLNELEINNTTDNHVKYLSDVLDMLDDDKKLYFASSCSVYGKQKDVNEDSKTQITSIYSDMKYKSEQEILKRNNPNYKILRFATLYGNSPLHRNDVLINEFVDDIINKQKLYVFDSKSTRPHLHVLDCANILSKLLVVDYKEPILNIGSNELNITKNELVDILHDISPKNFSVSIDEPNDSRSYRVNFDKLNNIIQYDYIPFNQGIKGLFFRNGKLK